MQTAVKWQIIVANPCDRTDPPKVKNAKIEAFVFRAITNKDRKFEYKEIGPQFTDENGYADFSYAPYNENRYVKAEEVFFEIADLSNSVFVEVHAQLEFSIKLRSIEEKV